MSLAIEDVAVLWTACGEVDFKARIRVFRSGFRYVGGVDGSGEAKSDG